MTPQQPVHIVWMLVLTPAPRADVRPERVAQTAKGIDKMAFVNRRALARVHAALPYRLPGTLAPHILDTSRTKPIRVCDRFCSS